MQCAAIKADKSTLASPADFAGLFLRELRGAETLISSTIRIDIIAKCPLTDF